MKRQQGWIELLQGKAKLSDLIDATERRRAELDQPKSPAFFLYVDQGEELYVRAEERERRRFSELLAQALPDPRLRAMMSMRSDFLGSLQSDTPLFKARLQIDVPPLGEDELREVVSRPAQLLGARFETEKLVDIIARRAAEDSVKDVGALPLLSYTLDDMWSEMLKAGDGVLRLPPQSFELGGVLVDRANRFLAERPGAEDALRRVLTLKLATVREDGEPTRRRASRAEFSDEEWRLVSELSGYPNRLLVTVDDRGGRDLRRGGARGDFPALGQAQGMDRRRARVPGLAQRPGGGPPRLGEDGGSGQGRRPAHGLRADAGAEAGSPSVPTTFRKPIGPSSCGAARRRSGASAGCRRSSASWLRRWPLASRGLVEPGLAEGKDLRAPERDPLKPAQERALKPGDSFKECRDCPEMIVVPAGHFTDGLARRPRRRRRAPAA